MDILLGTLPQFWTSPCCMAGLSEMRKLQNISYNYIARMTCCNHLQCNSNVNNCTWYIYINKNRKLISQFFPLLWHIHPYFAKQNYTCWLIFLNVCKDRNIKFISNIFFIKFSDFCLDIPKFFKCHDFSLFMIFPLRGNHHLIYSQYNVLLLRYILYIHTISHIYPYRHNTGGNSTHPWLQSDWSTN